MMRNSIHLTAFLLAATPLACGEPSPVLVGHMEGASVREAQRSTASGYLEVDRPQYGVVELEINGANHTIPLDEFGAFAVDDLPTGDVAISVQAGDTSGEIKIDEVSNGELINVSISAGPGHLEMRVMRRVIPSRIEDLPPPEHFGPIEILGNHVTYYLEPGYYEGDVIIRGERVTLVGSDDCDEDDRSVIAGDLIVHGDDVYLVNVSVRGKADIGGRHVSFYGSCGLRAWWK